MKFKKLPINDYLLKKEILVNLYNDFNLNRFRYTQISNTSHVEFLQKNIHYILLNYASRNYLLYFKTFNGVKMCVIIERKTLEYKPKTIDDVVRKAQIFNLELNFTIKPDIYKGTLLDVKMVNNFFQVYNVFIWKGIDRTNESSSENFRILNNEKIDIINEVVIYDYSQLEEIKQIMIDDPRVSGIIFIPKIPGNQLIFLNNSNTPVINKPIDENTFYIFKTEYPDVYFLQKDPNSKDKKLAYVPSIKESRACSEWFESNPTAKYLLVNCIYKDTLDKWVPSRLV
jgi:hypothetical protein